MSKYVFAGTGFSDSKDSAHAGREAVEKAVAEMEKKGGKTPGSVGFLFCSTRYDLKKLIDAADKAFDGTPWVGCTGGGEISDGKATVGSVTAAIVSSSYINFGIGFESGLLKNPKKAGRSAASKAIKSLKYDKEVSAYASYIETKKQQVKDLMKRKRFFMITLSRGMTMKRSGWEEDMIEGIREEIGINVPIFGGTAADEQFVKNYQFVNGQIFEDTVICVAVFSNVKVGMALGHGLKPTNKVALVTKSKGNIVYELDNMPAVDYYARLVGVSKGDMVKNVDMMNVGKNIPDSILQFTQKIGFSPKRIMKMVPFFKFMAANPFGIPDISGEYWTKVPKGVLNNKYLLFYNNIPHNVPLTLMSGSKTDLVASTAKVVKEAMKESGKPALLLLFECMGRFFYLEKDREKIFKQVKSAIKNAPLVGLYSGAEFGGTKKMPSGLHTYTSAVISIGDELLAKR